MGKHRLALKKLALTQLEDDNIEVKIVLEGPGRGYEGVAFRRAHEAMEAAVSATLDAISQALSKPISFEIREVAVKELKGGKTFVVVLLKTDYFIQPVGEAVELLGACQVTGSDLDAAARATLNATNRAISLLLKA